MSSARLSRDALAVLPGLELALANAVEDRRAAGHAVLLLDSLRETLNEAGRSGSRLATHPRDLKAWRAALERLERVRAGLPASRLRDTLHRTLCSLRGSCGFADTPVLIPEVTDGR